MEILADTIEGLVKPLSGINTKVVVQYSGSVLSDPPRVNFDAPIVQHETLTFVVTCTALGIRGQSGIYQLVSRVRQALLGKRCARFDPLTTAIVEVSSQYMGEVESGKYSQALILQVSRPITTMQSLC